VLVGGEKEEEAETGFSGRGELRRGKQKGSLLRGSIVVRGEALGIVSRVDTSGLPCEELLNWDSKTNT